MSPKWKTFLTKFFKGLGIVILVLGIVGAVWWNQAKQRPLPMIDGEITLDGLDGPVDVYRDSMGVPHIYATTTHDLFMIQGYIQAQDRFWQMDFQRHTGMGRLSELMGSATVDTDKFLQTIGWERTAKQELAMLNDGTLAIIEAFSDGVNAYISGKKPADLALEYNFIALLNPGYEMQPWEPLHTLVWGKAMAWDLKSNMSDEILRAKLSATLTPEQIAELFPPYPPNNPYILKDQYGGNANLPAHTPIDLAAFAPALHQTQQSFTQIDALLNTYSSPDIGSNNWVIGGSRTDSGMPYLLDDMHLPATIPHIWYEIGLHCMPKGSECPFDVAGVTFSATPGIVVGHNDFLAWGYTNNGSDVSDLYIEKINPDNPYQYEFNGEWVDMDVITETIKIGKKETLDIEVRITNHGPIITDVYGLSNLHEESNIDLPENYAIALRWTALEPIFPFQAIYGFNRAQSYEEFREYAKDFGGPAQNIVYADIEGNIAYQMPGNHPIRSESHSGLWPVPGWTDEYEWQGYIPFEDLPALYNPPEDYIATANNPIVGPEYPYPLEFVHAYGYRARRIVDLIENAPGKVDIPYLKDMQGDSYNLNAAQLVPILLEIDMDDEELTEMQDYLSEWDYVQSLDSSHTVLFSMFWKYLVADTFDELPEDYKASGGERWFGVMSYLIDDPNSDWWDDQATPETETRNDIFRQAFKEAYQAVVDQYGSDPDQWNWGELHAITFKHEVMNNFPLINNGFSRGPFPTSGGSGLVNNTGWSTNRDDFMVSGGTPSQRLIVDLSDLTNSFLVHPTGESGHPASPHYIDMAPLWSTIQYTTLYWDLDALKQNAEGHLHFTP